jgi:hypothetical protein
MPDRSGDVKEESLSSRDGDALRGIGDARFPVEKVGDGRQGSTDNFLA